ncbi:hypothetical protein PTKU64_87080 [Paraburkholderia terrae]|uniref:Uncharacterized protein n=1 Tax=Paraburkholderia terrae TaxID=311230 RepID=A0ABN6JVN4_9BURK|nr:hypothetical protein PTKU64_87080 [Paraburkholderia terrae]BDC44994.1 hypothetical protein PTKU15_82910 [Paraburkholderia terrae]
MPRTGMSFDATCAGTLDICTATRCGATWEDAFRLALERRLPDSHEYSQHLRGGPSQAQQLPALKATLYVSESENQKQWGKFT